MQSLDVTSQISARLLLLFFPAFSFFSFAKNMAYKMQSTSRRSRLVNIITVQYSTVQCTVQYCTKNKGNPRCLAKPRWAWKVEVEACRLHLQSTGICVGADHQLGAMSSLVCQVHPPGRAVGDRHRDHVWVGGDLA